MTATPSLLPSTGRRLRAFTLIELLTVIAIIGVLAAILIPTISTLRASAKSSRCVTNLRQAGVAIQTHASDNKGSLPAGGHSSAGMFPVAPYFTADPRNFPNSLLSYLSLSKSSSWNTGTLVGQSYAPTLDCPGYKGNAGGSCYELQRYVTLVDGTRLEPWGWTYQIPANGQFVVNPKPLKSSILPASAWAMRDRDFSTTERNHSGYQNTLYFDWHVGRVAVN